jgi:serine/threonine protein kinase
VTPSNPPVSGEWTLPDIGDVIGGKYEIERALGEGGMCVVMAAKHLQLEERVAIKLLRPEFGENEEVIERFMREGRAAIRIRNDHVVRVHDVDVLPSGTPYLVMEHLEGSDLDALILAHGPSPVALAVDYVLQAAEAIAEAHSLEIVHRDLKPANLFLTKRADGSPWIKVLDFGISRMAPQNAAPREVRLTGRMAVMGSPNYMSPEQLRSTRDVDHRTDIWALGTILHELISGKPAFDGPSVTAVCAKIMDAVPASLIALRPEVPPGLAAIVLRCLKKRAEERFASMGELAVALADFASPAGKTSAQHIVGILSEGQRPAGGILVRDQARPWGSTDSAWERIPKQRSGFGVGLVLAALLLVGGVGSAVYVHSASNPAPAVVAGAASIASATSATNASNATTDDDAGAAAASASAAGKLAPSSAARAPMVKSRPRPAAPAPATPPSAPAPNTNLLFDERK